MHNNFYERNIVPGRNLTRETATVGRNREGETRPAEVSKRTQRGPPPPEDPDKPGGRNDPLMVGLSGAGVRWYRRYLERGETPEIARRNAEMHRGNERPTDKRGNKTLTPQEGKECKKPRTGDTPTASFARGVDRPGTNSELKPNPSNVDYAAALKTVRLAVLPQKYPDESLMQQDLEEIEEAIFREVLHSGKIEPSFNGIKYKPSMLLIECKNGATAAWLKAVVPALALWKGVELTTKEGDEIPKPYTITLFLPKCHKEVEGQIINYLAQQNQSHHITEWQVIRGRTETNGLLLTIGIGEMALKALVESDFKISYRFGNVTARLSGGKKQLLQAGYNPTNAEAPTASEEMDVTDSHEGTSDQIQADEGVTPTVVETPVADMDLEVQIEGTVPDQRNITLSEERVLLGETETVSDPATTQ